jgi:hypothetical protein
MMTSRGESQVAAESLLALSKCKRLKVFRNNIGVAKHADGRVTRYGVGPNGAGDYLGWETVTITPDMVGQRLARFVSIEFKREKGGRVSAAQTHWASVVNDAGGLAAVVSSPEDARRIFHAE